MITDNDQIEIETPLDRNGSFMPKLVKKQQARFASMDDKILSLYAKV
ncbi:transposase [Gynuella sunshinyii]